VHAVLDDHGEGGLGDAASPSGVLLLPPARHGSPPVVLAVPRFRVCTVAWMSTSVAVGNALRRRSALFALFFLPGLSISSWVTRTPAIRDLLGASTAEVGLVLLGLSVGSMAGIPTRAARSAPRKLTTTLLRAHLGRAALARALTGR
jgi:hypothetical protein